MLKFLGMGEEPNILCKSMIVRMKFNEDILKQVNLTPEEEKETYKVHR